MSLSNSQKVVEFRQRRKQHALEAFGSKCGVCGYDKCPQALEFHHLDPKSKEFSFSVSGNTYSWEKTVPELRKCVCLCSNCHREVHAGITEIPTDITRFDEDYASKKLKTRETHPCSCCGRETPLSNTYCSLKCAQVSSLKIEWPSDQIILQMVNEQGFRGTGRVLGVSDNAVRKRLKRQGLL